MIKIECDNNKKVGKIEIVGNEEDVCLEMSRIGKIIAQKNELVAGSFLIGMAGIIPKEKMLTMIDRVYKSREMGNAIKKAFDLGDIEKMLSEICKFLGDK